LFFEGSNFVRNRDMNIRNSIRTRVILLVCSAAGLAGCTHYYYTASVQNVPLFRGKAENIISFSTGWGAGEASGEIQAAIAPVNHFGLMAGFFSGSGGDKTNNRNWQKSSSFEAGLGYFTQMKNSWLFEFYGGYGGGSEKHRYSYYDFGYLERIYEGDSKIDFSRFFFQPAVGWHYREIVDIGFSSRLSFVSFGVITSTLNSEEENKYAVDIIRENRSPLFIEPALTIRGGYENFKLQVQIIRSINTSDSKLLFEPARVSIGIIFKLIGKGNKKVPPAGQLTNGG
jgi:hypothetical protein